MHFDAKRCTFEIDRCTCIDANRCGFAPEFPGHGCMDDLPIETSFDSKATWVIDILSLFFDMLSTDICTTRHWKTSGRLMQELNVCNVVSWYSLESDKY